MLSSSQGDVLRPFTKGLALLAGPWNESWNVAVSAVCNQRTASTAAGLSVQAEPLGRRAVLMGKEKVYGSIP